MLFGVVFAAAIASGGQLRAQTPDFRAGNIIDDSVFTNNLSMTAAEIDLFLEDIHGGCDTNGELLIGGIPRAEYNSDNPPPYTCLYQYENANTGQSAGEVIKEAADLNGINPQALVVMLEKENSLVTDDWPWDFQYQTAMGFACPDSGPNNSAQCNEQYFGFRNQVNEAAELLRGFFDDQPGWFIPFSTGEHFIGYHPNSACGGSVVDIENRSTAALYGYTPYQPNASSINSFPAAGDSCGAYGNRNFYHLFNNWFGSTHPDGFPNNQPSIQGATNVLAQTAATDSGKVEFSAVNSRLSATSGAVVSPLNTQGLAFGGLKTGFFGENAGRLVYVKYENTGSDTIELHTFNQDGDGWQLHQSSNHVEVPTESSEVVFGDVDGDGIDEAHLIRYSNTRSGQIAVHEWNEDLSGWTRRVVTIHPEASKDDTQFMFADIDDDGIDEPFVVKYDNTRSNSIAIHQLTDDLSGWELRTVTSRLATPKSTAEVLFSNDGQAGENASLVIYEGTQSGKISVQRWADDFMSWDSQLATDLDVSAKDNQLLLIVD